MSVEVDRKDLLRLVAALKAESDGKQLRRELVAGLRAAVQPAVQLARGSVLSMGVHGVKRAEPPLRTAVAAATKASVRLSGKRPGVRVVVRKSRMPRGFRNAPKKLNSTKPWRHPLFGNRDVWVSQVSSKPGWFDDSMRTAYPEANEAAKVALDNVARRISMRTRG